ncbi:hypothetical protein [Sphingobium sp. TCM1]|uniref:hypothetical protein n=1 Tax=Sphingobium sp. TCM1 TaxID=453246 RepID=UPI0007F4F4F1|nr:hypothetical protein [Sphingobium sp. TCM1]OAN53511.1 hypothetical protein A7Q26_05700 [Sphingobium sp. TCM1]
MTPISPVRFNAIAGYARQPQAALFGIELGYFEVDGGRIVGMLLRDRADRDHFGMVFAQDRKLRFRSVAMTAFVNDPATAEADLALAMDAAAEVPIEEHWQADEKGEPVDFFTPVHPVERLNPDFVALISEEVYSPARGIIEPMMRWYEDADGNFVEQFQTTGFDQRIWELYLFATFIELGYVLDRTHPMPDFVCSGLAGAFSAEAVTVGPTRDGGQIVPPPPRETSEQRNAYLRDYMPIKFGSPLSSKLKKRYWERPHIAGGPFVLAVADFSSPGSMMHTASSLERYLYGLDHVTERDAEGRLIIKPQRIEEHRFGTKAIPSGFFRLSDAKHVGAVLTSASGTISKFNRMGLLAGFGSGNVVLIRQGTAVDHDPDASEPKLFRVLVNSTGYDESWVEGLNVFHNPNAELPLDPRLIPGAGHHFLTPDGERTSSVPHFHPYGSMTQHFAPVDVAAFVAEVGDRSHIMWTLRPAADGDAQK